jgi:hypothetical protein
MAMNDSDFELLHAYLDGELPVAECEGLWRRLAIEKDLVGELDRLRADHAIRTMVWNSLEPDDATLARLGARMARATRREDIMGWASNALRIVASAAALILFGFTVGWFGKDRMNGVPIIPAPSGYNQPTPAGMVDGGGATVEVTGSNGKKVDIKFNTYEEAEKFVHDVQSEQSATPAGGDTNPAPQPLDKF